MPPKVSTFFLGMEEWINRSQQPGGVVAVCIEMFFGTGAAPQVIELGGTPLLPITAYEYDTTTEKWELVPEANYTTVEGSRTVTFTTALPVAPGAAASDKNVVIVYQARATGSEAANALSPAAATIELREANPTGTADIAFSPTTGKGNITSIVVVRTHQQGTPYTPNTRSIELFDVPIATPPVTDYVNTRYLDEALEPAASGRLINKVAGSGAPGDQFAKILVVDLVPGSLGVIGVSMSADGGAPDSQEDYSVLIGGEELK